MSFLKGAKDEALVNVRVEVTGDLGKKIVIPFKARFRRYRFTEAQELLRRSRDGELTDDQLIRQVLIDWREMPGADGEEVPFSQEALDEALEIVGYRVGLVKAFMGQQYEIDAKNL